MVPSSGVKLIKGLSLEVYRGQGLLVMGPRCFHILLLTSYILSPSSDHPSSGSGKTSLLRVLRGLWPSEGGVAMVERQQVTQNKGQNGTDPWPTESLIILIGDLIC